ALFDEPLRFVFRDETAVSGPGASHDPARAALPRAARRHLRSHGAGARLQLVPARPDADGPVAGAAWVRELLRAVAGAAPRVGGRLVEAGAGISGDDLRLPRKVRNSGITRQPRDFTLHHARHLRRRAGVGEGRGVFDPAGAD